MGPARRGEGAPLEGTAGFWLVIVSSFFFALTEYVSKIAIRHVPPTVLAFYRSVLLAPAFALVALLRGELTLADGRTALVVLGLALLGPVLVGCAAAPPVADPVPEPAPPPAERSAFVIGESVEGREIRCESLGSGPETILVIAAIHGNEGAGAPLVRRLAEHLSANPSLLRGRRVLIVPVANPDGLARRTRANAHGVDLNRNFPTDNFRAGRGGGKSPLSEPESRALFGLLTRHPPRRVVSVHLPLGCVDLDGPGEELARAMADASGLPLRKLGGRPGSLGSWVGLELGRPIVTLELPRGAGRLTGDELWSRYGRSLLVAIVGKEVPAGGD